MGTIQNNEYILNQLRGTVEEIINREHHLYSFQTDCNNEVWKRAYLLRMIKELHVHLESVDGADKYYIAMNRYIYDGFTEKQKEEAASLFDIMISDSMDNSIIHINKKNFIYVIDIDIDKAYDNEVELAKEHD